MCQTASHFHRKSEAVCILVTNVTEKNIGTIFVCIYILCIRWRKKNEKQMLEYAFHWFNRLIKK